MTYYKVKKQYDNAPRYITKDGRRFYDSVLIGGELYTEKERKRYAVPESAFEVVSLPKDSTFISFGVRFALA